MLTQEIRDFAYYSNLLKGNYAKGVSSLRSILMNAEAKADFLKSSAAMTVVFGDFASGGNNALLHNELDKFPTEFLIGLTTYLKAKGLTEQGGFDEAITVGIDAFINDAHTLEIIVNSSAAMGAITENEIAMAVMANSSVVMTAIAAVGTSMNLFLGSQYYVGRGLDTLGQLENETLQGFMTMEEIVDSEEAMDGIAENSIVMNAIVASEATIYLIVSSEIAMNAVVASNVAMALIAESIKAVVAIYNNPDALALVQANSEAYKIFTSISSPSVAKVVATLAGLNPNNFADMAALANSNAAMAAVFANNLAFSALAASYVAMIVIVACPGLMNIIVDSTDLMAIIAVSSAAMTAIAASSTTMKAIATSLIAITAIEASSVAIDALNESPMMVTQQVPISTSTATRRNGRIWLMSHRLTTVASININVMPTIIGNQTISQNTSGNATAFPVNRFMLNLNNQNGNGSYTAEYKFIPCE